MDAVFFVVTLALYFAAAVSFLADLLWPSDVLSNLSLGMTATGFASHTIALGARMSVATEVSLPGFQEALSFFSWISHIAEVGWNNWSRPETETTAYYAEYKCTGLGFKPKNRVKWAHQLTDKEAEIYTVENVFAGKLTIEYVNFWKK